MTDRVEAGKYVLVTDFYFLIEDAGAEEELECRITYTFHPGCGAYTPRGEYAPTEPPEPDRVEDITIDVRVGADEKARPIWRRIGPDALHDCLVQSIAENPDPLIVHARWEEGA